MAEPTYDFNPVSHVTIDALGPPGQRTFFFQASQGLMVVQVCRPSYSNAFPGHDKDWSPVLRMHQGDRLGNW